MARCMPSGKLRAAFGFSYIGVLITLAIAALGLSGAAVLWQFQAQRTNERALLEIGEAYRVAIGRYYEATPGQIKTFPPSIEVLLEDKRFPKVQRHLRRAWADPFFPKQAMQLIVQQGVIVGVASQSQLAPIRSQGYLEVESGFSSAKNYQAWQFIYTPNTLADLETQVLSQAW